MTLPAGDKNGAYVRSKKGYRYHRFVRREGIIPAALIATTIRHAAAWLENNPQYDAHTALRAATESLRLPEHVANYVVIGFREAFGVWGGDDESVTMLCFAAVCVETGDL